MRKPALILLLCFTAWSLCSAQQEAQIGSITSTLLKKSTAALQGGVAVVDATLTGSVVFFIGGDQHTGRIDLWARRTADSRVELSMPEGQRTEVHGLSGGVPACVWAGNDGKRQPGADHNCLTDAAWFFPALSSLSNPEANLQMRDLGLVTENGLMLRRIRIWRTADRATASAAATYARLTTMDYYIDPQSSLPLVVRFNIHPDDDSGHDIPVEIRFADYRDIGGVRVPFRIQKLLNGSITLDITISNSKLNSDLPDALFAVN